jgi:hypothetical protein
MLWRTKFLLIKLVLHNKMHLLGYKNRFDFICFSCISYLLKTNHLSAQVFPKFFDTEAYRTAKQAQDASSAADISVELCDTHRFAFDARAPFVVYELLIVGQLDRWRLFRRYSELRALHTALQAANIAPLPTFPPRRLLGAQRSAFVARRRQALATYLQQLQRNDAARHNDAYRAFFVVHWHARRSTLPPAALARVRNNARLAIASRPPRAALAAARAAIAAAPRDADVAYNAAVVFVCIVIYALENNCKDFESVFFFLLYLPTIGSCCFV